MVLAAAENNARWCDAVCRSHGLDTRFTGDLWHALGGAPRFYPDVVTLLPAAAVEDVLACAPASVKDSFACLDLAPAGFAVLFEAQWLLHRTPRAGSTALAWSAVSAMDEWAAAAGLEGIIRAPLLDDPDIRILAGRHGEDGPIAAGAILNATGAVVGVTNAFGDGVWADLPAVAAAAFPSRAIVGYEHGDALGEDLAAGFEPLHPLRVWARGGAPG
jgi:hypothetical protein